MGVAMAPSAPKTETPELIRSIAEISKEGLDILSKQAATEAVLAAAYLKLGPL